MKKVAGGTTTVYIFSGSKVIAEYVNGAAPSSPTAEYIYAGGTLLAKINSSGTDYFHQDHLSNRIVTNSSGTVVEQLGHFPFGESWYNGSAEKWFFTTYERDSESGNDYAMARYHVSRIGRLSSPDPLAGSIPDPQSLNRYAYSINDPANVTDPSGLWPCTFAQDQSNHGSQARSSSHGGPSADIDDADGSANGSGQSGCYGTLSDFIDGGVSLDGFDITDTGGGEGMGFPIGGGDPGQIASVATTITGYEYLSDHSRSCLLFGDCGPGTWLPIYGNLDAHALLGGGSSGGGGGGSSQISKHYDLKTPCNISANQVMSSVESNFSQFGNYSRWGGLESVTFSPPAQVSPGSTIPINVGVFGYNESLSVTVQSMNSNSMTFTTNPGHLLYPAHITFAASPASPGSINFNIQLGGTVAQPVRFDLGGSSFEDAQWNHFLQQIRTLCQKKGS